MAFLVEDGTGVEGANAYTSVDYTDQFHIDRNNEAWFLLSNAEKQAALIRASDYIDQRFDFIGYKQRREQGLDWPRYEAYDRDEFLLQGVPIDVQKGCAEYAIIASAEPLFLTPIYDPTGLDVKSTSVVIGPIEEEITYATGSSGTATDRVVLKQFPIAEYHFCNLVISSTELLRG